MKVIVALALLFSSAVAAERRVVSDELVAKVNKAGSTWTASLKHQSNPKAYGTFMPGDPQYKEGSKPLTVKTDFKTKAGDLPTDFSSMDNWAECADVIGHIRDQSDCGSCWAFSSTETLNDRMCIVHGEHALLSTEDTNDCASLQYMSMGCNGGQPRGAWEFFVMEGVSSGGDNSATGAGDSCKPYAMASCYHHGDDQGNQTACTDVPTERPTLCKPSCSEASYPTAYADDKRFAKSAYAVHTVDNIMQEIYENGPVTVAFTVYEDFEAYESGIYQHVSGRSLGGHAVKMVGWGGENGTEYWNIANSWNPTWGENGFFRILKGVDECGIESSVVAGAV
jgi:cathepsin B